MADIRNDFSWSFSRHKIFNECRRRYYWNYYGYWGGWSPDAPDEARLAYRLKKMSALPMWLGDIVHRIIERILGDMRNRELNSLERYQEQARTIMNREWKQSLDKQWQWKPKWNLNLFEHYYGIDVAPEECVAARQKVFRCIEHFMNSSIFDELDGLKPNQWRGIEDLAHLMVDEAKVWVKIDCAAEPDGELAIYDWKTGKETPDTEAQLGCYALYASHTWRIPLEKQRLVSFYVDPDTVHEYRPTAEGMIETKDLMLKSMSAMRETLDGPVEDNTASMQNFPMTEERFRCKHCFFRELCFGTRKWDDG